jgi:hypothetical protein
VPPSGPGSFAFSFACDNSDVVVDKDLDPMVVHVHPLYIVCKQLLRFRFGDDDTKNETIDWERDRSNKIDTALCVNML